MSWLNEMHAARWTATRYARDTTLFPIVVSSAFASKASRLARLDPGPIPLASPRDTVASVCQTGLKGDGETSSDSEIFTDESDRATYTWNPLSMLLEGVLADAHFDRDCTGEHPEADSRSLDSQPTPPPPPDVVESSDAVQASEALVRSNHGSPSPASSPSLLPTPTSSLCSGVTARLDQTLAELIAENAVSSASGGSVVLELPEKSLLLQTGAASPGWCARQGFHRPARKHRIATVAQRSSWENATEDAQADSRLTMPGGGPLLESPWSGFWCSSPAWTSKPTCIGGTDPSLAQSAVQQCIASPPPRPPRPPPSCLTLEFGGDGQENSRNVQDSSPTLRSVRKSPAEYLKSPNLHPRHRPSTSSCSLYGLQSAQELCQRCAGFELDLDQAPTREPATPQRDRNSGASLSTFVSAQTHLSAPTTSARGSTSPDHGPVSCSSPLPAPVGDGVATPSTPVSSVSKPSPRPARPPQLPTPPRSATHSSRIPPPLQPAPVAAAPSTHAAVQRKPWLVRKLSLPLSLSLLALRWSNPSLHPTPTPPPTDYSKPPHSCPLPPPPRSSTLTRSSSSSSSQHSYARNALKRSNTTKSTPTPTITPAIHTKSTRINILDSSTTIPCYPHHLPPACNSNIINNPKRKVSFAPVPH